MEPVTGRHSVMLNLERVRLLFARKIAEDYPDSVSRVRPPKMTMPNTLAALPRSQYATALLLTFGKELRASAPNARRAPLNGPLLAVLSPAARDFALDDKGDALLFSWRIREARQNWRAGARRRGRRMLLADQAGVARRAAWRRGRLIGGGGAENKADMISDSSIGVLDGPRECKGT
jgi:hypothetical protein